MTFLPLSFKKRFLVIVLMMTTPSFGWSASIMEMRTQAKSAFRQGDYSVAAELYQKMVSMEPERIDILKEAMWAYWNMRKTQAALEMAEAVKKILPDDPEAAKIIHWVPASQNREKIHDLQEKARAAYQQGKSAEAIELYREIAALDPKNIGLMRDYMWVLWNTNHIEESVNVAGKVLALNEEDRDANRILVMAPERRASQRKPNSPNEMVSHLRERIADHPDDVSSMRRLMWTLFNLGRFREAQEVIHQIVNTQPTNPEIWYQMGKVQQSMRDIDGAITSYKTSLSFKADEYKVLVALGKIYIQQRDLDSGVRYLERAMDIDSGNTKNNYPVLAKALYYRGDYKRAAEVWAKAATVDPSITAYRYYEAEALYFAGEQGQSLEKMRELKIKKDPLAIRFLIDSALARKDYPLARQLLEEKLTTIGINDGRDVIRLVNIYLTLETPQPALVLLDRWSKINPDDIHGLLYESRVRRKMNRFNDAIPYAKRILELNANNDSAYIELGESYFALDNFKEGLKYFEQALQLEPTNPYFINRFAQALYKAGRRREAREWLTKWIKENENQPYLPILLYHGLSPIESSPMMSNPIHVTIMSFESQMRMLAAHGYRAVTVQDVADWYAGKKDLPSKPVLITFDDARIDGFQYADPILAAQKMKATMFVPTTNIFATGAIGYASWEKVKYFQDTGRWEIQSHGADAHTEIKMDETGRKITFLLMPQWLDKENRLETKEEWIARIEKDHQDSIDAQQHNIGTKPVGYAYPLGYFGQMSPRQDAVPVNVAAIKKYFQCAFIQNDFGLNVRSQNPYFLYRIEPPAEWAGPELIAHINDENPVAYFYRSLLSFSLQEKKNADANLYLAKLKALGVSNQTLLIEQAQIAYASGDASTGYQLAMQSIMNSNGSPARMKSTMDKLEIYSDVTWRPMFAVNDDNEGRTTWNFYQELLLPLYKRVRFHIVQGFDIYEEKGLNTLNANAIGLGLSTSWGNRQEAVFRFAQKFLSGDANDATTWSGNYRGYLTEYTDLYLEAGRGLYGNVQAINDGIRENRYRGVLHAGPSRDWGAFVRGRQSDISEGNQRKRGEGEISWKFWPSWGLGPVYRFIYDDMKNVDRRYYSPQNLHEHQFGPQFELKPSRNSTVLLQYFAGLAKEEGSNQDFVQGATGSLQWAVGERTFLNPSVYYLETPTYKDFYSALEFQHTF